MYIYAPDFDKFSQRLSRLTGLQCSSEPQGPPAATLIVRANKTGGVAEPGKYITDPATTLVIAGFDSPAGMDFAQEAMAAGVPESSILFVPGGSGLSFEFIAGQILNLIDPGRESPAPEEGFIPETSRAGRVKVIAVLGFRGGVGRTTVATSLAIHYTDIGERVALLDLGAPPASYRYTGAEIQEQEGFKCAQGQFGDIYMPAGHLWELTPGELEQVLGQLKNNYRRVLVDMPSQVPGEGLGALKPDRTVVVMDHDIVQSVEPAAELRGQAVFVYNRYIPATARDLVTGYVGEPLIVIKDDPEGCQAALVAKEPAYRTSEDIARGIGEVAARIQEGS
ncbi:hypothetical protein DCCM_4593 [Desulfocucumis palustris]|uniref:CobQ/CobB/MinD/ParA nucleotide binding domain-containing protein n=1 Tax=Desulfocucumis palustris TaxID=1898651 RepID=A0A2L2XHJ9_9FIRM|nr:cellulose synthase operon protein YhjQ/BcsQ [Desulfocucumis palustris]GBF35464.1 hypothetical protein DCCM_4593 [Desulfocucumis palustris]